jgi:hypothetical protein
MSATAGYLHALDCGDFPRVNVQQDRDGQGWSVVVELGVSADSYAEAVRLARWHNGQLREALAVDLAVPADPWGFPAYEGQP